MPVRPAIWPSDLPATMPSHPRDCPLPCTGKPAPDDDTLTCCACLPRLPCPTYFSTSCFKKPRDERLMSTLLNSTRASWTVSLNLMWRSSCQLHRFKMIPGTFINGTSDLQAHVRSKVKVGVTQHSLHTCCCYHSGTLVMLQMQNWKPPALSQVWGYTWSLLRRLHAPSFQHAAMLA